MEEKTRAEHDEGEARESEATFSCSLSKYCKYILPKISYFITLNPYKKHKSFSRLQKIGPVYDILRKRFSDIFIVQETNSDKTKHYHAIAVGPAVLPLWNPKGMKVHIQRIGGAVKKPEFVVHEPAFHAAPEPSVEEKSEIFLENSLNEEMSVHHHLYHITLKFLVCLCRLQSKSRRSHRSRLRRQAKALRIGGALGRLIKYMTKEIGLDPTPYVDYILQDELKWMS